MKFETLTTKNLPSVLIHMLASEPDELVAICTELRSAFTWKDPRHKKPVSPETLALWCANIIETSSKGQREAVQHLNRIFDNLSLQGIFGPNGKYDPRGERSL